MKPGDTYTSAHNARIEIVSLLGEGGRGVVYKIKYNGQPKVLKVCKPSAPKDPEAFCANLQNCVEMRSPGGTFLWPLDVLIAEGDQDGADFGYVLELLPEGCRELSDFLTGAVKYASFRVAIDAALQIVSAFHSLHSAGLCFHSLHEGCFCIHPRTGRTVITGFEEILPAEFRSGILGKPRYMAPELVRGEAMPSPGTDRFSLAVILFLMITMSHPLEGARSLVPCLTPEAEERLYGTEPIFILDPDDKRNAPVRGIHDNVELVWPELPAYVKEAFLKSFTGPGLKEPNRRLTEKEWQELLIRFRSDVIHCPCGNDNFTWDAARPVCSACGRSLGSFRTLEMSGVDYTLPIPPGSVVFRGQLDAANAADAGKAVLRAVMNPADKRMYLQNVSGREMECVTPTGRHVPVADGAAAPAAPGIRLHLACGTVRVL